MKRRQSSEVSDQCRAQDRALKKEDESGRERLGMTGQGRTGQENWTIHGISRQEKISWAGQGEGMARQDRSGG